MIIVNDGSTDDTADVAESYAARDPRVRVIHRENGGVSAARNIGLASAVGEVVFFLDADDWADPKMISSLLASSEELTADVVVAGAIVDFHDAQDKTTRSEARLLSPCVIEPGKWMPAGAVDESFVNLLGYPWNKAYKREWLMGLGEWFDEDLTLFEDLEFNARILAAARRVALVGGCYVHYVQRPAGSLGTECGSRFLTHRLRAIQNVDALLVAWAVDDSARRARLSVASGEALWGALVRAAGEAGQVAALRTMLAFPEAAQVVSLASSAPVGWRACWATATVGRGWFGVALLPARVTLYLEKTWLSGLKRRMKKVRWGRKR